MLQILNTEKRSVSQVWWRGIRIYLIAMLVYLIVNIIYTMMGFPKCESNPITQLLGDSSLLKVFCTIVLIGPIYEEVAFRLWISFKKRDLAIGLGFLCSSLLSIIFNNKHSWMIGGSIILLSASIALIIWFFTSQRYWNTIRDKFGRVIIWSSIILFAVLHITNCSEYHWKYLFVYVVLIPMPRIATAYVSSYYRLNIGFIYSLIFHIVVNVLIVTPQIFRG